MRRALLAAGIVVLSAPVGLGAQATAADLQGAWRVVEISAPGMPTVTTPQPGLLLFVGRHYSYTFVTADEPRPMLPGGVAPAEYLLTVWNPFTANAGTFEIAGDRMTRRPTVAKSPNAMVPGAYNEYTFRLSADTLWVTTAGTETGPARNPTTVRYERER